MTPVALFAEDVLCPPWWAVLGGNIAMAVEAWCKAEAERKARICRARAIGSSLRKRQAEERDLEARAKEAAIKLRSEERSRRLAKRNGGVPSDREALAVSMRNAGMRYRDIAEATGIPMGTIAWLVHVAKKKGVVSSHAGKRGAQ